MHTSSKPSTKQVDCRFSRRSAIMLTIVGMLLVICPLSPRAWAEEAEHPEILWDVWGVPHIYAKSAEDLFYAFGWSQMVNHGDLILRLYGCRTRGTDTGPFPTGQRSNPAQRRSSGCRWRGSRRYWVSRLDKP